MARFDDSFVLLIELATVDFVGVVGEGETPTMACCFRAIIPKEETSISMRCFDEGVPDVAVAGVWTLELQ